MGSRGVKSQKKLDRRKKVTPQEFRSGAGHVHHVPGSQNLKKN